MSNLFYSGSGRHTSGAFTVTMKDGAKLAKQIAKLENGGKAAIQRTVSDFNSRAPAWVSKGIRQHYGVDTAAIKSAGPQKKRGDVFRGDQLQISSLAAALCLNCFSYFLIIGRRSSRRKNRSRYR